MRRGRLAGAALFALIACSTERPTEHSEPITRHVAALGIVLPDSVKRGDDVTFSYTLRQSARQGEQTLTQGTQQLTFTLWVRHGSRPDSVPVSGAFSDSAAADIPLPVTPTVGDTIQIVGSGTATLTGLDGRSSQLQVWGQGRTRIVDRRGSVLLSVRLGATPGTRTASGCACRAGPCGSTGASPWRSPVCRPVR